MSDTLRLVSANVDGSEPRVEKVNRRRFGACKRQEPLRGVLLSSLSLWRPSLSPRPRSQGRLDRSEGPAIRTRASGSTILSPNSTSAFGQSQHPWSSGTAIKMVPDRHSSSEKKSGANDALTTT